MAHDPEMVRELYVPNRTRILFVDDDPRIHRAVSALLHRDRLRWEMVFVLGGEAGLDALRASTFDILITDLRMPGMDGTALLAAAKRYSPRTVRIMLTGSIVDPATIDAYAILDKPCSQNELRDLIERVAIESTAGSIAAH